MAENEPKYWLFNTSTRFQPQDAWLRFSEYRIFENPTWLKTQTEILVIYIKISVCFLQPHDHASRSRIGRFWLRKVTRQNQMELKRFGVRRENEKKKNEWRLRRRRWFTYETEGESRGCEEVLGSRIRRPRRRIVGVVVRHVDDAHGSSSHLLSKWLCFMGGWCGFEDWESGVQLI